MKLFDFKSYINRFPYLYKDIYIYVLTFFLFGVIGYGLSALLSLINNGLAIVGFIIAFIIYRYIFKFCKQVLKDFKNVDNLIKNESVLNEEDKPILDKAKEMKNFKDKCNTCHIVLIDILFVVLTIVFIFEIKNMDDPNAQGWSIIFLPVALGMILAPAMGLIYIITMVIYKVKYKEERILISNTIDRINISNRN